MSSATAGQRSAITGGTVPATANNSIRVDNISNSPTDDSAHAIGSKIRMEVGDEVFGLHNHKSSIHRDDDCRTCQRSHSSTFVCDV